MQAQQKVLSASSMKKESVGMTKEAELKRRLELDVQAIYLRCQHFMGILKEIKELNEHNS